VSLDEGLRRTVEHVAAGMAGDAEAAPRETAGV
jgi:hypothetical protein